MCVYVCVCVCGYASAANKELTPAQLKKARKERKKLEKARKKAAKEKKRLALAARQKCVYISYQ